ncbi:MAG: plasmid replication protein, CyRepA1 family [Vulcanococcus sp.]
MAASHWQELQASAIPADLAALNFRSFGPGFADAAREREALLYEAKAQAGDQPGHAYQRLMRLDAAYSHMLAGGWRFVGDALPGFEPFCCWKPDAPRLNGEGRPIKYEHPPKAPTGIFLPQVSERVWRLVAKRNGLAMPADRSAGFWAWVMATPELRLVIDEGGKKTVCLLGLGFAAIGLPGVHNGRRVPTVDGERRPDLAALIPELAALAVPGRRFVIAFDRDEKPSTAAKVERAAVLLGHLLVEAKCDARVARIPDRWWASKTGPDDLVADGLGDELIAALADPLELAELAWEHRLNTDRRILPTITTHGRRLMDCAELSTPPSADVIAIRSAKGSGKTELLAQWLAADPQVLAVTHRRSLGAALAGRLALVWRNDLDPAFDRNLPRLALCADSLLGLGDPARYAGATLVLDEVVQVVGHLLSSSTKNCAEHRGLLLQRLQGLIRHCRRVVLLDADLDDATLRWVREARGEGCEVVLIDNPTKPAPWPVTWWEHAGPEAIQQALIAAVKAGERPLVLTDSRKAAEAIHHLLQTVTGRDGLAVHRDTVDTPEVKDLLPRLNDPEAVKDLAWLVASPSISSGVSIEHSAFDRVFGLFHGGSLDDAEALQALARIRPCVRRDVWVKPNTTTHNRVSRSWWPAQVERDLRERWSDETKLLRRELRYDLLAGVPLEVAEGFESTVKLWAHHTARRNYSHSHLRAFVLARLRHEGHSISREAEPLEQADIRALQQLKTQLRDARDDAAAEAIAAAPILTKAEAQALQHRQFRTPLEQAAIQRRALCDRLALVPEQLTPGLAKWGIQWAGHVRRLLHLLHPDLAAAADLAQLRDTTTDSLLVPWDQGLRLERSRIAEAIGLRAFVEKWCSAAGGDWWSSDTDEVQAIAKVARDPRYRQQVANAFGIHIGASSDPIRLVASLLKTLGITTEHRRIGNSARQYRPEQQQLRTLLEGLERLRQQVSDLAPLAPECINTPQLVEPAQTLLKHTPVPPPNGAGGWRAPAAELRHHHHPPQAGGERGPDVSGRPGSAQSGEGLLISPAAQGKWTGSTWCR